MWERTLIESKAYGRDVRRLWTIPTAAALHGCIALALFFVSYWRVEAVEAPPSRLIIFDAIPVHIAPPPRLGGGSSQPKQPVKSKEPVKLTQPQDIAELKPENSQPVELPEAEFSEGFYPDAPPGPGRPDGVEGGLGELPGSSGVGFLQEEQPQTIVAGVTPPVLLKRVEPEYPRIAIRSHLEGIVVLEAVITKTGDVEQAKTLRADHVLFEQAATNAVLRWKYKPALVQGRPIKVYFTVTVTFHLK